MNKSDLTMRNVTLELFFIVLEKVIVNIYIYIYIYIYI